MKLYLVDTEKLHTFDLPNKVNGSFLFAFKEKDNRENTFNIDAIDDKWVMKSNGNVNIIANSTVIESATLRDYIEYKLQISGHNDVNYLYALPSFETKTTSYEVKSDATLITIGKVNCNISYNNEQVLPAHLNISKSGNDWYVVPAKEENALSFLNNNRIKMATKIYSGDIIFINGLKIIWMKKFLIINNSQELVTVNGLNVYSDNKNVDNTQYGQISEEESMVPLYDNNDYFSHTPRIRTVIEHEEVKIDSPPGNQEASNDLPMLLAIATSITMVASAIFMLYYAFYSLYRGGDKMVLIPRIALSFIMLFGSLVIPRIVRRWQKKQRHKREMLRQQKYGAYLAKKEQEIQHILNKQIQILNENFVSLPEVEEIINNNSRLIWSRELKDDDFLKVRIGIGSCPSNLTISAPQEHFSLDEDELTNKVYAVNDKYNILENVPITFSFANNNISSFIFDCNFRDDYINGLLLQLFAFHSPLDLKIVLFTSKENEEKWHYLKKLPHLWNSEHNIRFFSSNPEEIKNILTYLDKEFTRREEMSKGDVNEKVQENRNERKDAPYTRYNDYYLILTDDFTLIKNSSFLSKFLLEKVNLGFSLIIFGNDMKNLPQECSTFIQVYEKESGIFNKDLNSQSLVRFKADYNPMISMEEMASSIANIPIKSKELSSLLPTSISFLEMYNVGKIEQLNILNRWVANDPTNSLSAPIGVHVNGDLFKLDLHEKYDGPHGLIAGSTGSGKSEFIITYILSMAVNYHPEEVQFVLIDYKGGGLSGAFENKETGVRIPHIVGTITNLDTAEMNRSLVSIESELKRRQAKFNEVRDLTGESTMDIYKYQRLYREGAIKEPMSHLFIISDEFAELKSQQPDFMAQLISTSRIGRSLGVHLILATQKPSGVVNDQIWSNSRFKVCLKVQTRADSNEMLKRPEAASLKEAGRFYLQVGYDEYFDVGQSGYTGTKYIPAERIIKKFDETVNFINNNGEVIKTVGDIIKKEETEVDLGDQLTNIVKYLYNISVKENINPRRMWLDSLPGYIGLDDLVDRYKYVEKPFIINPIIGEYDWPQKQSQGLYSINLSETGNVLIRGIAGSGKENLLSTIIYSICTNHSPKEVNIYIGDFGAETLTAFNKMPHVGDVFTINDSEKLFNLVKQLDKELETRKKEFIDYGGSYIEYNKQNENKLPLVLVVLNAFEAFTENYSRQSEMFDILFRDGAKYGIVFIVSTSVGNAIRARVATYFPNKIALKFSDNSTYRDFLGSPRNMVPSDKFGRGIGLVDKKPLEFQSAFITEKDKIAKTIRDKSKELMDNSTYKAPPIKTLPNVCYLDSIIKFNGGVEKTPIGIEIRDLDAFLYDFSGDRINVITASSISAHIYFVYSLIKEFLASNNKVVLIDALNVYKGEYDIVHFNDKFDDVLKSLAITLNQDANSQKHTVYIFIGPSTLKDKLNDQNKVVYEEIFKRVSLFKNSTFIFADDYAGINNIKSDEWYRANVDNSCGIWLGDNIGSQLAFDISSLTIDDKGMSFPYIGFAIHKGNHVIIKYVVDGLEEENGE